MDESLEECGAGLDCRLWEVERPRDWRERERKELCSCLTSVHSCNCSRSCGEGEGVEVAAMVGAATLAILSESAASSSMLVVVLVDASTTHTFGGKRCRNSSCKNVLSVIQAQSQLIVAYVTTTETVYGHLVPRH